MRPENSELLKLRAAVRQVFREKTELKEKLEAEINKHKEDAKRYGEEQRMLESEINRLQNTPQSDLPSPEASGRINEMMRKLDDLAKTFRQAKIDANECLRANSVLEKEVEQHKATLSTLEDDLMKSEEDRTQRTQLRLRIGDLEDVLRDKEREEKELELSLRLKKIQLEKLEAQLSESVDQRPVLLLCRHQPLFVGESSTTVSAARTCFQTMTGRTGVPTDTEISEFLAQIPRRVKFLCDERRRLKDVVATAQANVDKLSKTESPSPEAVDKLKDLVQQLATANAKRKARIAKLTKLADEQHASLQRLTGGVSATSCGIPSLRELLRRLGDCPAHERAQIAEIADRALDAVIGLKC